MGKRCWERKGKKRHKTHTHIHIYVYMHAYTYIYIKMKKDIAIEKEIQYTEQIKGVEYW